ncbi:MAG: MarR family winged helix-turn-helix transcriptional regulator [Actinomycetota bacterium]
MANEPRVPEKDVASRETPPRELADRLGYLLGRTHLAHRERADEALQPLGLRVKEFGALLILTKDGPLSQCALAARQGIDRTTMVGLVDELEGHGFVERRRSRNDRRAYELHVTAKGRRVLKRAIEATVRTEKEFLQPLSAKERRQLKQSLQRLLFI